MREEKRNYKIEVKTTVFRFARLFLSEINPRLHFVKFKQTHYKNVMCWVANAALKVRQNDLDCS